MHAASQHSLDKALIWFRRDLRTHDNAALHHALRAARQVWCVFVFDCDILEASTPELDDVVRLEDRYGRVK